MEAFVYFLLGILASLIINLLTPFMQERLDDTILVNRQKRQKALEDELDFITKLHNNASEMGAAIAEHLTVIVSILAFEAIAIGSTVVLQALSYQMLDSPFGFFIASPQDKSMFRTHIERTAWVLLAVAYLLFILLVTISFRISRLMRKVRQFEKYKQEVETRLLELQPGSGSDLDQE